jgi:hypothetical protein
LGQWLDQFDRIDMFDQFSQHGRLVSAAGADIEPTVGLPRTHQLTADRHDVRLGDRLLVTHW